MFVFQPLGRSAHICLQIVSCVVSDVQKQGLTFFLSPKLDLLPQDGDGVQSPHRLSNKENWTQENLFPLIVFTR
jgi:hypothetical protein